MKKGKLIVIEGACDGIGKTTQFNLLRDNLKKKGYDVVTHHFPSYDTIQGLLVEYYLKGEYGKPEDLSPYFVHNLYSEDRSITYYKKLKKALEKDKIVLLDRYTTSSLIYQSALMDSNEKNEFIEFVEDYEYNKLGIRKPDKVLFLYAPYELVQKQRKNRTENEGVKNDIHESNEKFLKQVYKNSLYVSKKCNWDYVRCFEKDEIRSINDIQEDICKLVLK